MENVYRIGISKCCLNLNAKTKEHNYEKNIYKCWHILDVKYIIYC